MSQPITYSVLAGDGQQHGPYPAADIQAWIDEGRITADQQMIRSDLTDWFRAGGFSEFVWPGGDAATAAVAPLATSGHPVAAATAERSSDRISLDQIDPVSLAGIRDSGSWFYWIAGLSAVNFGLALGNTGFGLAVGSFFVDVCAAFAKADGGINPVFVLAGALVIGFWAMLGVFARRAHRWAFIVGMSAFGLDTLLLLLGFSVIGLLVHGYILYKLFDGLKDAWALHRALRG